MSVDELEAEILKLDAKTREHLIDRVLRSLGEPSLEEWNRLWSEECERREKEMDRDPSVCLDGDQVMKDLRAEFG